jgi:hypothetical protein
MIVKKRSFTLFVSVNALLFFMQYGHWSHTCHMAKHLIDLYQSSLKGKEKNIKINFSHPRQGNDDIYPLDMTHLDVIYIYIYFLANI